MLQSFQYDSAFHSVLRLTTKKVSANNDSPLFLTTIHLAIYTISISNFFFNLDMTVNEQSLTCRKLCKENTAHKVSKSQIIFLDYS